jgi:type 1 glutamine amidotransferase
MRGLLLAAGCSLAVVMGGSVAVAQAGADEKPAAAKPETRRVLLLAQGPDGHPATTHEYAAGLRIVQKCLERIEGIDAVLLSADEPWKEGPAAIDKADGVVLFLSEGAKWIQADPERLAALQRLARRGGAFSVLHWGMGTRDAQNIEKFVELFGGCHGGPDRKYKVVTVETEIAAPKHPIMTGVTPVKHEEEYYYRLKFAKPEGTVTPLLRVPIDGEPHTVAWAWSREDKGRSFGFSGCHFHRNWQEPSYRRMVTHGILWTLHLPIPAQGVNVDVE